MYVTWCKDPSLPKNADCHLSFQQVVILLLLAGLASILMAADWSGGGCWRWGWPWQFLKNRIMRKIAASIDSSLSPWWFLCSTWCCVTAFPHSRPAVEKIRADPLKPCPCLSVKPVCYSQSFVVPPAMFTASSPGVHATSRFRSSIFYHFLCSCTRCNSASVRGLSWDGTTQPHFQAPLRILVLLLFPPHLHSEHAQRVSVNFAVLQGRGLWGLQTVRMAASELTDRRSS